MKKLRERNWTKGSITVFLSFLFILMLFLVFAVFDHVRAVTSKGYTAAAARSAAVAVYGSYNRELYDEYHLFGYGGYGLKDVEGWREDFLSNLSVNLGMQKKKGADFYRFENVQADLISPEYLNQEEVLLREIKAWQKVALVKDGLSMVQDRIEEGNASVSERPEVQEDVAALENSDSTVEKKSGENVEKEAEEAEESTVKNPIAAFKNLLKDGVLHLVCDENKLTDQTLHLEKNVLQEYEEKGNTIFSDSEEETSIFHFDSKKSDDMEDCKNILQQFSDRTKQKESENGFLQCSADKLCVVKYASDVFSNYSVDKKQTTQYGMEYLVAGHANEKDNLLAVVNRLYTMRLLVNFAYVEKNEQFRAESLSTATAIAGVTGVPAVIKAVQHTILLILAMEESSIDISALLEGRRIPLYKSVSNFQMKYVEIANCSRAFFQRKASIYPKNGTGNLLQNMSYENFMEIMLASVPQKKILNRMCQLIQYDLQEKHNKTFVLSKCIAGGKMEVWYQMPYFFPLLSSKRNTHLARGRIYHHIILSYRYR